MNVLLDHCVPRAFGRLLAPHAVRTTASMNWNELQNGALLAAAAESFDVFVTVDSKIDEEQNLASLPIPVLSLVALSNRIEHLAPLAPKSLVLLGIRLQRRVYIVKP